MRENKKTAGHLMALFTVVVRNYFYLHKGTASGVYSY